METERVPEPSRFEKDEVLEGRGREIALEAMKEDKRIWMGRSSGVLEKVFVTRVLEDAAECCWLQPDGSAMTKQRLFTDIVRDQKEAVNQGLPEQSEVVDAYIFLKKLRENREEKQSRGWGRDRVEPLHVFDTDAGEFCQISDTISFREGGPEGIFPEETHRRDSPFVRVEVKRSEYEEREKPALALSPVRFVRDQIAYFMKVTRMPSYGQREAIEKYLQDARERELAEIVAQRREEWRFKDHIRKESGYENRITVGDVTLRLSYHKQNHAYYLTAWKERRAEDPEVDFEERYKDQFEIGVNYDWDLSKDGAVKAFEFAVAQIQAGKTVADAKEAIKKFIDPFDGRE